MQQKLKMTPGERERFLKKNTYRAFLTAEQIRKLFKPAYQRSVHRAQVKRLRAALRADEHLPDLILSERKSKGQIHYRLVDGLQRGTAAMEEGYPMGATIIRFKSEEEEKDHFIKFQRSRKINPSHICLIDDEDPINKEILRVTEIPDHPLSKRIWYGQPPQPSDSIPAITLAQTKKKGLEIEDMEDFTRFLIEVFDPQKSSESIKSGAIRGVIGLFYKLREEKVEIPNATLANSFKKFQWEAHKEFTKINSKASGEALREILWDHVFFDLLSSEPPAKAAAG